MLTEVHDRLDMTITVDWDVKQQTKPNYDVSQVMILVASIGNTNKNQIRAVTKEIQIEAMSLITW